MYRLRWYCCAILNGGRFGDLRTIYQGCRALPFALAGLSCIDLKYCVVGGSQQSSINAWGDYDVRKPRPFHLSKSGRGMTLRTLRQSTRIVNYQARLRSRKACTDKNYTPFVAVTWLTDSVFCSRRAQVDESGRLCRETGATRSQAI